MPTEEPLAPCPFCGGKASAFERRGFAWVQCVHCCWIFELPSQRQKAGLAATWNALRVRRASRLVDPGETYAEEPPCV